MKPSEPFTGIFFCEDSVSWSCFVGCLVGCFVWCFVVSFVGCYVVCVRGVFGEAFSIVLREGDSWDAERGVSGVVSRG